MSENAIAPRYGVNVYMNQNGHVCIQQEQEREVINTIILHHEEATHLIPMLKNVIEEALDFVPNSENEDASTAD